MKIPSWEIDRQSPVPYYHQLERYITQEIEKNIWKKGDFLPSENEIANRLGVSVGVVRQAYQRLEQSGIIKRQKGKQAQVVIEPKVELKFIQRNLCHFNELKSKGFNIRTKVLEARIILKSDKIAGYLKIKDTQPIIKIFRVRYVEGEPVIAWTSFLPATLCPGLEKIDLRNVSLYDVIYDRYGLQNYRQEGNMEVVIAARYESKLLKLQPGEAVIYIESIGFLQNNRVLEYYEGWHRADKWKFNFSSNNTGDRNYLSRGLLNGE